MFNVKNLTKNGHYLIEGERGEWHYSGTSGNKYNFWRKGVKSSRRISISLSESQVQRKVWSEVQTLNLSQLEAFCNQ